MKGNVLGTGCHKLLQLTSRTDCPCKRRWSIHCCRSVRHFLTKQEFNGLFPSHPVPYLQRSKRLGTSSGWIPQKIEIHEGISTPKGQTLRKPDSGLMQLAMSPACNARGQIRRRYSGQLELSGEGAPARCQTGQDRGGRCSSSCGLGWLTSPHRAVDFSCTLCCLLMLSLHG